MNAEGADTREDETAARCIDMVNFARANPRDRDQIESLLEWVIRADATTAADAQACTAIAIGFVAAASELPIESVEGRSFLLRRSLVLMAKATAALENLTGRPTAEFAGPVEVAH